MDDDCLDLKSLLSICLFFFCRTQYYPLYRSHVYDDFHEIRFDKFVFFSGILYNPSSSFLV